MVDERGEKCKWWMKGEKMQMVEEWRKIKYEITTGLFSLREHHILGL
jgi:hypothetical protein